MSPRLTACLLGLGSWISTLGVAQGQDVIYRCGNEYTNSPSAAQMSRCRVVDGANVTVVRTQPSAGGAAPLGAPAVPTVSVPAPRTSSSPGNTPRVESAEQRARDADARAILEAELRKSETRLADLHKEYNNGEPEKQGTESRNHQRYLDRVAELKASISRTEADIAGIRRELARFGGVGSASK
jgi:hypothetical protein